MSDVLSKVYDNKKPTYKSILSDVSDRDFHEQAAKKISEQKLQFESYIAPDKMINAYSLIGKTDIFAKVSATWQGQSSTEQEIKDRLSRYAKRRHQIVHEGDLDSNDKPRPIQASYAHECADFMEKLVTRLDSI